MFFLNILIKTDYLILQKNMLSILLIIMLFHIQILYHILKIDFFVD